MFPFVSVVLQYILPILLCLYSEASKNIWVKKFEEGEVLIDLPFHYLPTFTKWLTG